MKGALHAEWTKLRTTAGPLWLLLAVVAVAGCPFYGFWLVGIHLAQAPAAILAVVVSAGEHGTGLIAATLTAVPNRSAVLTAKAVVLTAAVSAAGGVAVLGTALPTGSADAVLRLVLVALIALGVGTAVCEPATATGVMLSLLYLPPILALTAPAWQHHLQRFAPLSASLAVLALWAAVAVLGGLLLLRRRDM